MSNEVPLIMLTHRVRERRMNEAIASIERSRAQAGPGACRIALSSDLNEG